MIFTHSGEAESVTVVPCPSPGASTVARVMANLRPVQAIPPLRDWLLLAINEKSPIIPNPITTIRAGALLAFPTGLVQYPGKPLLTPIDA